ncbi:hypothetical protein ZWY2020_024177 [Hordeum vulgare]|nr:hypothetical protein ZWY2020_024177 [Hordeum vulgare]
MAAAASFLVEPSPLARPPRPPRPRPHHSLHHLARAAAARPPAGPLGPPASSSPRRPLWELALRDLAAGPIAEAAWRALVAAAWPLVVALASAALILGDAGSASAFVVATSRKLQADELATVRLFKDNTPSIVYITNLAVMQDAFTLDVLEVPQGSSSGFIWDKLDHIVTNFHVIRGASDLRLAQVVGFDQDKDVVVLSIEAPKDKLRPLPVGVSADLLVRQKVYAIGNPVSPLLDSSGNLIGVNTAIYSPSGASYGAGFSIPVDIVGGIVDKLIKFGKVTRPILGITFAPVQSVEQLGFSGVLVLDAPPNGPAGKAVTVEVLRGDKKEKIVVVLEPKLDET